MVDIFSATLRRKNTLAVTLTAHNKESAWGHAISHFCQSARVRGFRFHCEDILFFRESRHLRHLVCTRSLIAREQPVVGEKIKQKIFVIFGHGWPFLECVDQNGEKWQSMANRGKKKYTQKKRNQKWPKMTKTGQKIQKWPQVPKVLEKSLTKFWPAL